MKATTARHKHGSWRWARALKWVRVAVSVCVCVALTAALTVGEAHLAMLFGWLTRMQIVPLAVAGSVSGLMLWGAITLLFGRVYCSSVCPMGTLQDLFARLPRVTAKQRRRRPYHYAKPRNRFRYAFLTAVAGSIVVGMSLFTALFDPFSIYSRVCHEILRPLLEIATGDVVGVASALACALSVVTLGVVAWFSVRKGRFVCNVACPVGNALSIFSRFSLMHIDIDTDHCVNCRKCENVCKSQCINMEDHVVDGSRCVMCFNCLTVCEAGAIRYTAQRKRLALPILEPVEESTTAPTPMQQPDNATTPAQNGAKRVDRRQFLTTGLIMALTPAMKALGARDNEGYADTDFCMTRFHPVAPPGTHTMREFMGKCTGCGICVANCPTKVIRPSVLEYGWDRTLHPVMKYNRAYCLYDCTICTNLCPTGALQPLTADEKHAFVMGKAIIDTDFCIGCGVCERKCPRQAIKMMPRGDVSKGKPWRVAVVDEKECIGCGMCQYSCLARPKKAIRVNGLPPDFIIMKVPRLPFD